MLEEKDGAVAQTDSASVAEETLESAMAGLASDFAKLEGTDGADASGAGAASTTPSSEPAATTAESTPQQPAEQASQEPDENSVEYWKQKFAEQEQAFKGLQPKLQQLQEAERQRQAQEEARRQAEFQQQLAYMPPEKQETVKIAMAAVSAIRDAQQGQAVNEQAARAAAPYILAAQTGLEPELIQAKMSTFRSPGEMEIWARAEVEKRAAIKAAEEKARLAARAETGADAFGRGGAVPVTKEPQTVDEALAMVWAELNG